MKIPDWECSIRWMSTPEIQPIRLLSTKSMLRLQCKETERSVRLFEKWVTRNPWLDQVQVELAMPWFAYIRFNRHSKSIALLHFGQIGWRVMISGEIRKEVEGVTVAINGD